MRNTNCTFGSDQLNYFQRRILNVTMKIKEEKL